MIWPNIEGVTTERLTLQPLALEHAPQMVPVLGDANTYLFTGGKPPSLEELQRQYARQSIGHSPDGSQWWLNWIILAATQPVGYLQATVERREARLVAHLAWVLGPAAQRQGYAIEAARSVVAWLERHGATRFAASIHPGNLASARVAEKLGLTPTGRLDDDGEMQWASAGSGVAACGDGWPDTSARQ